MKKVFFVILCTLASFTHLFADDRSMAYFPKGTILMWYNDDPHALPEGWQICNGEKGTPNLIDRFPIGTANYNDLGKLIGAPTHTHSVDGNTGDLTNGNGVGGDPMRTPGVQISGDSRHAHTHSIHLNTKEAEDKDGKAWLPPATKIIFIMKL